MLCNVVTIPTAMRGVANTREIEVVVVSPVKIVQAHKHLPCHISNNGDRDATILVPFDQGQQIVTQDLEYHAHMPAVGPCVVERVQQSATAALVWHITVPDLG